MLPLLSGSLTFPEAISETYSLVCIDDLLGMSRLVSVVNL